MTCSAESLSNCIDASAVAGKAGELLDDSTNSALTEACVLHQFCLEEITHERYKSLRTPEDILESGEGDCTDQTVCDCRGCYSGVDGGTRGPV